MYTVIGHPRSRSIRVMWALEEMGLDYQIDPQSPRSDKVLALNGSGKIPLLEGPDGVVTDSVAILTYLADKHGKLTYPAGTIERARQDSLTQTIVAELDASLWLYAKHSFALPEDWRVPEVKPTAPKEFSRAMGLLEARKGDALFLAGDRFTIPDILISHCAGWGLSLKFPMPDGQFGAYLKDLRKRPAMERTLAKVQAHS